MADQRSELEPAARYPVDQAREIARRHATAVERREIPLVPEQLRQLQRRRTMRAADLQRVAAVAREAQRQEGKRGYAGRLERMIDAAAVAERTHRGDEIF